jgi:type VI secretion system protein ImpE
VFGTGGVYSWVPLETIASLTMNPPANPRDVAWRPGHLVLTDGLEGDILLPGLYPESHAHPDEAVKLGRATEWVGADGEIARGTGGKVFLTGDQSHPFTRLLAVVTGPANPAE